MDSVFYSVDNITKTMTGTGNLSKTEVKSSLTWITILYLSIAALSVVANINQELRKTWPGPGVLKLLKSLLVCTNIPTKTIYEKPQKI